jgi:hypothetical protein
VTPEQRLAQLAAALQEVGLRFLILGGHAVRFYGVDRNTLDFDLHVSLSDLSGLRERLGAARLFGGRPPEEGHSWRPADFRRFIIGHLPDGREERLEIWRRNHLLGPFPELYARRVEGGYGGGRLPFFSLSDLLRSKETERESDWQDIALLEEIQDARLLSGAANRAEQVRALSGLRSRTGLDTAMRQSILTDSSIVGEALVGARHPVTKAILLPFAGPAPGLHLPQGIIGEILSGPLRAAQPGSTRHLALIEVVRRACKQAAMDIDRRDKLAAASPAE